MKTINLITIAISLLILPTVVHAVNLGDIVTLAGGGVGDNGPATLQCLNKPTGVTVDSSGNLYIADFYNNRIRKVASGTGIITTIAGNGIYGFSGDNGTATSASLSWPYSVTVDSSGNLYFVDQYNNRIRKVASGTGIITTVVGNGAGAYSGDNGPATSASLNSPSGVTVDSSGNLYIADNNRIRKVDSGTGIITTVAGNGAGGFSGDNGAATSASLNFLTGVTVDSSGNLYIVDRGNYRIRKVDHVTGIITTVAGNGTQGFSGDNGTATAASINNPYGVTIDSNGNLYFGDISTSRIRKVDGVTGIITTVAGNGTAGFSGDNGAATSASLNWPRDVTVDSSGNLYIADYLNYRIRKVASGTGIITTVAGNGTEAYAGDNGPATSASFDSASGSVTVDSSGNLYIADEDNHRIRKVAIGTGIITTVAGNNTAGFSGDNGAASSASLNYPRGVIVDSSGNLLIADTSNHRIRKVDHITGIITTVAGNGFPSFSGDNGFATSAGLYWPIAVTYDSSGNLYIADYGNHRIRKVASGTGIITTVAGNGTAGFSGDNGAASSASLNYPGGVIVDCSGNLLIADTTNQRIRNVDHITGIITTVAGNGSYGFSGDNGPATSANVYDPTGVTLDSSGNLYITEWGSQRIRKVYLNRVPTVAALVSSAVSNSSVSGSAVTFTATVTSTEGIPTNATVTFRDGAATIGSGVLDATGTAAFTTSSLAPGSHNITASYPTIGILAGSTSPVLVQTVIFSKIGQPTVSVSVYTGGIISPNVSQSIPEGNTTTFTISSVPGYHIASVTGCDGSLAGTIYATAPITADCSVTAQFAKSDVVFDEFAYLQANPDVAAVVKSGGMKNGWEHYILYGKNEGRPLTPVGYGSYRELPYLFVNPDVAAVVKSGGISSGWVHYRDYGENEGRPLEPIGFNNFNEEAYLAANPDVAAVVKSGGLSSGWVHYLDYGKSEGRPLSPVGYGSFKEEAYLFANPDIAAALAAGIVSSGWEHYNDYGRKEGRLVAPTGYVIFNESAYLAANPDLVQPIKNGIIDSGWSHYINYGKNEGRKLAPVGYANFNGWAYLDANTDVAQVVKSGGMANCWVHYQDYGKGEGRPLNPASYGSFNESDYLAANADIFQALLSGVITSGWQHYINWGINEGRKLLP